MKDSYPKPLQVGSRPTTPGLPNPTSPVLLEAQAVLLKTQDLQRAVRKLRRATQRCLTCPERSACPTMNSFAEAVDIALRELWQEWGSSQK
jgi:hypothetical protein